MNGHRFASATEIPPKTGGRLPSRSDQTSLRKVIQALRAGSYDYRARFPEEAGLQEAELLGKAIGRFVKGPFLVGRDTRQESRVFSVALIRGLSRSAGPVDDLGIIPTPVAGFEARRTSSVALVVSPSHNALGYVGLKVFTSRGLPWGREWALFRKTLRTKDFVAGIGPGGSAEGPSTPRFRIGQFPTKDRYLRHLSRFRPAPVRVVVDARGGATSGWAASAVRRNGGVVLELNPGQSSTFHGLSPEPTLDTLGPLRRSVRKFSADFGVAFDGDGDRAVFVDERGIPVPPEVVGMCLLGTLDGGVKKLVASADLSPRLSAQANVRWSKVGGLNIHQKMEQTRASIGIELSGHYYFQNEGFASDGILTTVAVAHEICRRKLPLSHYASEFGDLNRLIVRIRGQDRSSVLKALSALLIRDAPGAYPFCGGWRWGLEPGGSAFGRVSQTEPTVRLVCEGPPEALMVLVERLRSDSSMDCQTQKPLDLRRFRGWSEIEFRIRT